MIQFTRQPRAIRYAVVVERDADYAESRGLEQQEVVQCNGRKIDAIKRACYIILDITGWSNVTRVYVRDTWTGENFADVGRVTVEEVQVEAPIQRAYVGTAEAVEAEVSARNGYGEPFTYAEWYDDQVIATAGFWTLDAALKYARDYGFEPKDIEVLG